MSARSRIAIAGIIVAAAAVFATLSGATSVGWLKYTMFSLAIVGTLAAVLLISGGRLRRTIMCRGTWQTTWSICARCGGYYLGMLCSALVGLLLHRDMSWLEALVAMPTWALFFMAMVLNAPSAWHGAHRRMGNPDPLPHPGMRVITGFLSGLGWLLAYLGFATMQ